MTETSENSNVAVDPNETKSLEQRKVEAIESIRNNVAILTGVVCMAAGSGVMILFLKFATA